MKYKILSKPYTREEFKINDTYRGVERNEIPESKSNETNENDLLMNQYANYLNLDTEKAPVSDLLEVSNCFSKLSTEPFELILIRDIKEDIPKDISFTHLGYEVLSADESSMIHFWLRKKINGFEEIFIKHSMNLNENYLFRSVEDARTFIEDIRQFSEIISTNSKSGQLYFDIVDILLVNG